ncbi:O-antigen ligase family protein [Candidatus Peregrinibacteria bacterium]|nr:O-antigen ligase family protein [Candidatus Peregrinibacteria bacterium]
MKKVFTILFVLIFLSAALGELARLPVGPGILPNDILIAALIVIWSLNKLFTKSPLPKARLWVPFLIFCAVLFISLLNGSRALSSTETILSGFYLIRFIEYFLLIFVVLDLTKNSRFKNNLQTFLFVAAFLVAIFGFIQLKIYPDFTEMAQTQGWDPHINRLLSTWFDPNFVGGMLAFVSCLILGKLTSKNPWRQKIPLISILVILVCALFLTYSRSSYLAFLAGAGLIGLLRSRKLLIIGLITLTLLIPLSERAQERVSDMLYSAKSLITETAELPDATARLRLESWQNAITIFQEHPWLGVGYNAFSYAQRDHGFIKADTHHAASGSDSTILTILATSGLIGAAAYLWILGTILLQSFARRENPFALGFLAGFCGILIHAIFVNSLLYTPFLIFFYSALGIMLAPQSKKS